MNTALGYGLVLLAALGPTTPSAAETGAAALGQTGFFYAGGGVSGARSQGYLGVDVRDIGEDELGTLKLKDTRGAEIVLVDHDAPAGKAGLRVHDVVLQMNGQPIQDEEQLRRMLHESPPGKAIVLLISRDGQQITITTQLAVSQEEVARQAWGQLLTVPEPQGPQAPAGNGDSGLASGASSAAVPSTPPIHGSNSFIGSVILMRPSYTGAMLETISAQLAAFFGVPGGKGLLVRSVEDNSPAAQAGMRAGDVVVRVDQWKVASTGDWTKAVKNSRGRSMAVVVLRDKKEQTLTLTPDAKRHSTLEGVPEMGAARWRIEAEQASLAWTRNLLAYVR